MSDNIKFCKNCFKNKRSLLSDINDEFYAGFMVCFDTAKMKNITKCPICGEEGLVEKPISEDDIEVLAKVSNYNRQLLDAMIELHDKDIIEYELKMSQFRAQVDGQNEIKRQSNVPKCPHCKSTNIAKISGTERAASIIGLGIFSKKINKSFKCEDCGYTW